MVPPVAGRRISPGLCLGTIFSLVVLLVVRFNRHPPVEESELRSSRSDGTVTSGKKGSPSLVLLDPNPEKSALGGTSGNRGKHHVPSKEEHSSIPEVAWIMSYGGSGTSYTIVNVEQMTNATTASNYGGDYNPCIPLRPEWRHGPFVRSPQKRFPPEYILTKTHCGGYCMDCPPSTYLHTPESFEKACRTGQAYVNDETVETVTYNRKIPQAAIHLIRNPFDNLVGRMHLAVKHRQRRGEPDAEQWAKEFSTSLPGIEAWCQYLDDKYQKHEEAVSHINPHLVQYKDVPCRAEWYRYLQWHNLAHDTAHNRLKLPVHYLYFSNYTTQFRETVDHVLEFLQAPAVVDPYPFVPGKTYGHLFSADHKRAAAQMVKDLASPPVWELLREFFQEHLE